MENAKVRDFQSRPMLGEGSDLRATIGRNLGLEGSTNNALVVVDLTISSSSEDEQDEPSAVDLQLYHPVKPRGHGQKRQQRGEWECRHHFQDSHCTGSLPSKLRRKKTRHEQEDRAGMQKSQHGLHNHNVVGTLDSTDVVDIDDISPSSAPLTTSALGLMNDIGNRQDLLTSDRGRRGKLFHKNTPAPG